MANAATLRTYPAGTIAINGPAHLDRARSMLIPLAMAYGRMVRLETAMTGGSCPYCGQALTQAPDPLGEYEHN